MTDKIGKIVFCPRCGAEGFKITIEQYIPEKRIQKISMDDLAGSRQGNTSSNLTVWSHPQTRTTYYRAICKECGYQVEWEEYTELSYYYDFTNEPRVTDYRADDHYEVKRNNDAKDT